MLISRSPPDSFKEQSYLILFHSGQSLRRI